MRGLDGDLAMAVGEAARFLMGLAKFYTDDVCVVTVVAHCTCSNDSRTFAETRMTLR